MSGRLVKEAASLIVLSRTAAATARHTLHRDQKVGGTEDYSVLLLKRSSRNHFMPTACVFPGGGHDSADSCPSWWRLLGSCGQTHHSLHSNFRLPDKLRAGLYSRLAAKLAGSSAAPSVTDLDLTSGDQQLLHDSPLIPELSLRITALRETFEETGLLLAVPVVDGVRQQPLAITDTSTFIIGSHEGRGGSERGPAWGAVGDRTLADWRADVHRDANKFIELFTSSSSSTSGSRQLLPWLWGLTEWWSWLTPLSYPARRYDTMFYTAVLPDVVLQREHLSFSSESASLRVVPPSTAVKAWLAGSIWLAPPQVYELGRLSRLASLQQLQQSISCRTNGGPAAAVDTWLPQMYATEDGTVSLLPGDVLFSSQYSTAAGEAPTLHCSLQQLRAASSIQRYQQQPSGSADSAEQQLPDSAEQQLPDSADSAEQQLPDSAAASSESPKEKRPSCPEARGVLPLNRMEVTGVDRCALVVNVPPAHGQVIPDDLVQKFVHDGTLDHVSKL